MVYYLWGPDQRYGAPVLEQKLTTVFLLYFYNLIVFVNHYVPGTLCTKSFSYSSHSPMKQEEFLYFQVRKEGLS